MSTTYKHPWPQYSTKWPDSRQNAREGFFNCLICILRATKSSCSFVTQVLRNWPPLWTLLTRLPPLKVHSCTADPWPRRLNTHVLNQVHHTINSGQTAKVSWPLSLFVFRFIYFYLIFSKQRTVSTTNAVLHFCIYTCISCNCLFFFCEGFIFNLQHVLELKWESNCI